MHITVIGWVIYGERHCHRAKIFNLSQSGSLYFGYPLGIQNIHKLQILKSKLLYGFCTERYSTMISEGFTPSGCNITWTWRILGATKMPPASVRRLSPFSNISETTEPIQLKFHMETLFGGET